MCVLLPIIGHKEIVKFTFEINNLLEFRYCNGFQIVKMFFDILINFKTPTMTIILSKKTRFLYAKMKQNLKLQF